MDKSANTLLVAIVFAVTATLGAPPALADTVYQWVDANGVTHYSDAAPPKKAAARQLHIKTPARDSQPEDDYFSVINQEKRMADSLRETDARLDREAALRVAADDAAARRAAAQQPAAGDGNDADDGAAYFPPYRRSRAWRHRRVRLPKPAARKTHEKKLFASPLATPEGRPELQIPPPGAGGGGNGLQGRGNG